MHKVTTARPGDIDVVQGDTPVPARPGSTFHKGGVPFAQRLLDRSVDDHPAKGVAVVSDT